MSNRMCCVVDCHNTYRNTKGKGVTFYTFPSKKHEQHIKKLWIRAIRRVNENGEPWEPIRSSLVCSSHFVNNKCSKDPKSPSFIPTIFPEIYKKKSSNHHQQTARYKRTCNRQENNATIDTIVTNDTDTIVTNDIDTIVTNDIDTIEPYISNDNIKSVRNVSTQAAFEVNDIEIFTFDCCFIDSNNVKTQVSMPYKFNSYTLGGRPTTRDQSCGLDTPDQLIPKTFWSYESVKNESQLKSLTGTSFQVFKLLLKFIPESSHNTVTRENRLFIFLLIIKLGLSYSALSAFFKISPSTVTRIFYDCLHYLSIKTKKFIFWPDKSTVSATLPESFNIKYPNFRCIIGCTEIKTEQPDTVERKVYLYSRYERCYTIKILVAITPNGLIRFVSSCYGGSQSNSIITYDSGILSKLEPGDVVCGDEGFPGTEASCENSNCNLVATPISHQSGFIEDEVMETRDILTSEMEKVFFRLKTHGILNKISIDLIPVIDEIIHICCALTNLQLLILKK
ncbi:uncharacterized protein LOC100160767 [Acyrthosiphon pisum]|uniref:THAP-type domain-containing protein n=1 Tax=Acyrthosiphon pisum TaxID=7029 RepID=A0A8R2H8K7_ACYPI|nr:uncharacterized protein LOC100160767 [Acyrthosiphon pisum]|eukprot:XP_016662321.1 PREDICTED: uncharacterized protein LOC100160767 [Acyrthosiphon pisum]